MPQGYPDCLHPQERYPSSVRQMLNVSCGPAKIDGIITVPCSKCRLILENAINPDTGKELKPASPPLRQL